MTTVTPKNSALEAEQAAFDRLLPEMLEKHQGQFAVFHKGQLRGCFSTYDEAYGYALDSFGLDATFLISAVVERERTPASISWQAGVMFG